MNTPEFHPNIPSSSGKTLRLFAALGLLVGICLQISPAFAAAPQNAKQFATVWRLKGEVTATSDDGRQRPLKVGDSVLVGDKVRAAGSAEAVLKTEDAGMVGIRPGAEFVAEDFAAEGKPTDKFLVRLIAGSLRVITGWIGQVNRDDHKIVTHAATIGIRGTDHEPFVLSSEMAAATNYREGVYDKVNRGGTTVNVGENRLDVDAGKVGFARSPGKPIRTRALMTLLLPVLLDKVPDFYVPGQFEDELEQYSKTADAASREQLEKKRKASVSTVACAPTTVAKAWLGQLDKAVSTREPAGVLALFAPDVAVRANVRNQEGGITSVDLGREELVQSTLAALRTLKDYRQRRVSVEANAVDAESGLQCQRMKVKSVVIEQGLQAGKRYRVESIEEYLLELRDGTWLAIEAETTQR